MSKTLNSRWTCSPDLTGGTPLRGRSICLLLDKSQHVTFVLLHGSMIRRIQLIPIRSGCCRPSCQPSRQTVYRLMTVLDPVSPLRKPLMCFNVCCTGLYLADIHERSLTTWRQIPPIRH